MTTHDFKKILDDSLTPIKKQLGDIEERLDDPDNGLTAVNKRLDHVESGLVAINKGLDDPENGLTAINRRLEANTGSLVTIERDIKAYGDMYKINNSNAKKLEKRVGDLEENAGIIPPPEFVLAEVD